MYVNMYILEKFYSYNSNNKCMRDNNIVKYLKDKTKVTKFM